MHNNNNNNNRHNVAVGSRWLALACVGSRWLALLVAKETGFAGSLFTRHRNPGKKALRTTFSLFRSLARSLSLSRLLSLSLSLSLFSLSVMLEPTVDPWVKKDLERARAGT
jgi:hypothetical protein